MRRENHGFTLTELLVVMALVAILASILLPAIRRAQDKSLEVECRSHLRQLHLAASLYMGDWRGRLLGYFTKGTVYDHPGSNWTYMLWDYYRNLEILDCPVSPDPAPANSAPRTLHLYDGNYGWNYDGGRGNNGPLYAVMDPPSQGYLFFDSGDQCITFDANHWQNLMEELDLDWDSRDEGCNRHRGEVVVVFADGHSESRRLPDFLATPCLSEAAPWFMVWQGGSLETGLIPFPVR